MAEDLPARELDAATAFGLLANETRIDILLALWEAEDTPLGFSELYRRSGVDDSGQFNYHLEQLRGRFVASSDAGYQLSTAASKVIQSVLAGTVVADPTVPPTDVDEHCPVCDASVRVRYDDGYLTVTCTACPGLWREATHPEGTIGTLSFPPAALKDRTPRETMHAGARFLVARAEMMMDGVCPQCAGQVRSSLDLCEAHDVTDDICTRCGNPYVGVYTFTCATCRERARAPSFAVVHHHPIVEALYETGVSETPWAGMWRGIDWPESIVERDPPRVRTVVEHAGERHEFEAGPDGGVSVVE